MARRRLPTEIVGDYMEHCPVDVTGLADELGLKVVYARLASDVSGKIECGRRGCKITVNSTHGQSRQRFTIAHEIAHYVLHRELIGDGIVDDGLYRSAQPSAIERQANQYAADILMPWRLVRKAYRRGTTSACGLASMFQVSSAVAEIRLKELNLD